MATTKKEIKMVTVADLAEKYGVEGRQIRVLLRANGMKAPEADTPEGTFGPRAKYQWPEGSKDLALVEKLITESLEETEDEKPAPTKKDTKKAGSKGKGKSKKTEPEDEEEEDEEEDDEEDE